MKKTIILIALTIILAAGGVAVWYLMRQIDPQISWVALVLILFNLLLGWLALRRQPMITYLFFSIALLIELILLINKYWIFGRGL